MAEIFAVDGHDGSGWNISVGESDKIGFCGTSFGDSIAINAFQDSTHKTNADMSIDGCTPLHMKNCKYISTTQVKLGGASPVDLIPANVATTDCSTRWKYQDDAVDTELENVVFYAYNGSDTGQGPTDVLACAFERTAGGTINKDRLSDTPGDGGAWDSTKGIGSANNALMCSDQVTASIHYFYIGISPKPTSKGLKTAFRFRLEFDAQ
jgi:hypothetical protein